MPIIAESISVKAMDHDSICTCLMFTNPDGGDDGIVPGNSPVSFDHHHHHHHLPSCALHVRYGKDSGNDNDSDIETEDLELMAMGPLTGDSLARYKRLQQQCLRTRLTLQKAQQPKPILDPLQCVRRFPTTTCHLYPGSRFEGRQCSGRSSYVVSVDIKHVDLAESTLCGYLRINELTQEYPELTTFFDAEIVGLKHSFFTRKWDASEETDAEHWTRFKSFERVTSNTYWPGGVPSAVHGSDLTTGTTIGTGTRTRMEVDSDKGMVNKSHSQRYGLSANGIPQQDFRESDVIFMRWKEHFLVPDHRVQGINGASFAGFYYICYNKRTGEINGYYWHKTSEKFQELILKHVPERNAFGSFEFR